MAKSSNWSDDYWLLLMQLYLSRPVGMKPKYSRPMVELGMELHIHPDALFNRMCSIASLDTPRIERLWQTYSACPDRLARAVGLLRSMNGFNSGGSFYDGVETADTFERDFKPVAAGTAITPVILILILDLYFRLTPLTMVPETPEVKELAKLTGISPQEVAEVMAIYRHCDPYLKHTGTPSGPLLDPCRRVWQRYGNSSTEALASYASQLKEYFNG